VTSIGIVEADQREIPADDKSKLFGRRHHGQSHLGIAGEDRGGVLGKAEHQTGVQFTKTGIALLGRAILTDCVPNCLN
jgi:hypothetical protein